MTAEKMGVNWQISVLMGNQLAQSVTNVSQSTLPGQEVQN